MQWNKRLAWVWAAAGLFAVTSMLGACDSEAGPQTMGEGANHSIPHAGDVEGVTFLVGMGPGVGGNELKPLRVDDSRVSNAKRVGGC